MQCNYPNINAFEEIFFKKFPNSNLTFLNFYDNRYIRVRNEYGICLCNKDKLLQYGYTNIICAENKTEYFINQAIKIHGYKYNYSMTEYINSRIKLKIFCKKHGEFKITPQSHLQGSGCCKCGDESHGKKTTKTSKQYNEEIALIHNNNYFIKENSYINIGTKIPHYCNTQKEWVNMRPGHVLKGMVCRKCANLKISERNRINSTGWTYSKWEEKGNSSKYFDSFKVYIIKCYSVTTNEVFFKIGKTFQEINRRFQSKNEIPYQWTVLKIFEGKSREMSELETNLKRMNKKNKYLPNIKFNGMYECFNKLENYEEFPLFE